MKRIFASLAAIGLLVSPVHAADSISDVRAACVLGWAALSIEQGAKTVETAANAGWRRCRHIKVSPPKGIDKEDWREVEGDRTEELNSVIRRMFEAKAREDAR